MGHQEDPSENVAAPSGREPGSTPELTGSSAVAMESETPVQSLRSADAAARGQHTADARA